MKITKGTVSINQGSHIVNGMGTTWLSDGVKVGSLLRVEAVFSALQISRVVSDTELHVAQHFPLPTGVAIAGASYVITDEFTANLDLPFPARGDEDVAAITKRALERLDSVAPTFGVAHPAPLIDLEQRNQIKAAGISEDPTLILDFLRDNYSVTGKVASGSLSAFMSMAGGSFARASVASAFDKQGALVDVASGQPRPANYNPTTLRRLGFLLESARTNLVLNNSNMAAAAAGTPGTVPSGWSVTATANGVTREIVGTGVSDGIPFLRVRYYGTATVTHTIAVAPHFSTVTAASPGQMFTGSFFARLHAGALPSGTKVCRLRWGLSAGAYISTSDLSVTSMTGDNLRSQRWIVTGTAPATTERVQVSLVLAVATGASVDFTVDIGLFQLEQTAFATSPIKTSGSAVTYPSEAFSVLNNANWINPLEGTFFVEMQREGSLASSTVDFGGAWLRVAGVAGSRLGFRIYESAGSRVTDPIVYDENVVTWDGTNFVIGDQPTWAALAYKANDFAVSRDGGSVTTQSIAVPDPLGQLYIYGSGLHIRRVIYFPKRLTNAELSILSGLKLSS